MTATLMPPPRLYLHALTKELLAGFRAHWERNPGSFVAGRRLDEVVGVDRDEIVPTRRVGGDGPRLLGRAHLMSFDLRSLHGVLDGDQRDRRARGGRALGVLLGGLLGGARRREPAGRARRRGFGRSRRDRTDCGRAECGGSMAATSATPIPAPCRSAAPSVPLLVRFTVTVLYPAYRGLVMDLRGSLPADYCWPAGHGRRSGG